MEWGAFGADGVEKRQKGGYFICEGGYHYWKESIAPFKIQIAGSKMEWWSSNME